MIVKVEIKDKKNGEIFNMLFGTSYKKWEMQFDEYCRRFEGEIEILRAWKSKSPWKSWGGLKWCNEKSFQEELNREGVQQDEPDNPKPRQYKDMIFTEMSIEPLKYIQEKGY